MEREETPGFKTGDKPGVSSGGINWGFTQISELETEYARPSSLSERTNEVGQERDYQTILSTIGAQKGSGDRLRTAGR